MRIHHFAFALVGLGLLFSCGGVARAAEVTSEDLVRLVFPQMREDPETGETSYGATAIPVRRFTKDDEPAVLEGVTGIGASSSFTVPDGAATRYVLYLQVTGPEVNGSWVPVDEAALVAVFDAGPIPKLLDLVSVQTDRFTDFGWGGPVSRIGQTARAFTVYNSHHNSSQGYLSCSVIYVDGGRLKEAADLFLLSWGSCSDDVTEEPTLRVRPRRGSQFSDLIITVKVTRLRGRECDFSRSRRSVRWYTETYRWNAAKREYVDAGGTLGVVDKLNAASY